MMEKIIYEIAATKESHPTIIVTSGNKKVPLHSKFHPSREAHSLSGQFIPEKYDTLIVLGVGLGYHLIPLQEQLQKYKRILLIDKLEGLENHIAENELTSFLSTSKTISMYMGKDTESISGLLQRMIDISETKGISVIEHPASTRLFNEYYAAIKNNIKKIVNKEAGNKATIGAFGRIFLKNCIRNMHHIRHCLPVSVFEQKLAGRPALIVTSGTTLNQHIDVIQSRANCFFIICVDSALPVLIKNGIEPDFIISIDPQPYIHEHFMDYSPGNAIPVFSIVSPPTLVRRYSGAISMNSHPVSQVMTHSSNNTIGSIDSGTGSVIGDALAFALLSGCSRIGIVGLDFSFLDFEIYARGTAYQKRYARIFGNRLRTTESYNCEYIFKSSKRFTYKNKYSRKSFIQYKESLESFVATTSNNVNIWNINNRGIPIVGLKQAGMDVFDQKLIDKRSIISSVVHNAKPVSETVIKDTITMLSDTTVLTEAVSESLGGTENERLLHRVKRLLEKIPI